MQPMRVCHRLIARKIIMQQKIGFAAIVTLIAMLFAMTALGGTAPASSTPTAEHRAGAPAQMNEASHFALP